MTNVASSCVLPSIEQFIGDLVESQVDQAGIGVIARPAITVAGGIAADAVAASLAFVGLESFILASALSGENLTELLLELQQQPELQNETTTRIRTETQRCIDPGIGETFGMGSRPVDELQDLWNRNGSSAIETMASRTGNGAFLVSTPAQAEALRNWRRTMANLINCIEVLIEESIFCQGERAPRCRVPAIVNRCILRAGED